MLSQKSRDEFLLSTKVGRLVEEEPEQKSGLFEYGHQKKVITDYSIELALDMEDAAPTISLSATQYTLLKHERALQRMMPKAQEQGAKIVVGGPFNSGALLGGDHFVYAEIPAAFWQELLEKELISSEAPLSS